jgi:hypothetical protein
MEKINDEILKYLSGILNEDERIGFEEKLQTSSELASQLSKTKKILSGFDLENVEVNENYFNNLIPLVRRRIDSQRSFFTFKKLYYLAPALTVVLLAILFYPRTENSFQNHYQELAQIVATNIDDTDVSNKYLEENAIDSSYDIISSEKDFTVGLEDAVNKIPDSYLSRINNSNIEAFQSLDDLSDDDLNELCKELNDYKF